MPPALANSTNSHAVCANFLGNGTMNDLPGGIKLPIEVTEIMAMLPHRYPFLLIDRVIDLLDLIIENRQSVVVYSGARRQGALHPHRGAGRPAQAGCDAKAPDPPHGLVRMPCAGR